MKRLIKITISSSTGNSLCKKDTFSFEEYLVITNDSLKGGVNIYPEGDSVSIISYFINWQDYKDSLVETFVYGDYPNSTIPKPSKGQSISRTLWTIQGTNYHCLCDSSGIMRGILHGKIYDKENQLITSGSFNISPFPIYISCFDVDYQTDGFEVNGEGVFSVSLVSIIYKLSNIGICAKNFIGSSCYYYDEVGTVPIDPIQFSMMPDTIIEKDIHLLDDFVEIETSETIVFLNW